MRSHSLWVLGTVTGLALAGCASTGTPQYERANLNNAGGDAEIMSYRIRNWSALNDHTLMSDSP